MFMACKLAQDALLPYLCLCMNHTDAVAYNTRQFGGGAGPIYLDNVACSGSESNLLDCPRSSFVSCYSSRRGAGVRCQGTFVIQ